MNRSTDWIQTVNGFRFWPLEPEASDVYIADIAHALSLRCRFGCHCREFYSVAQHSVYVSRLLKPEHALWGLLHDASEAYLPDVCSPIKKGLTEFRPIEEKVLLAVATRFALPWPMPEEVKQADKVLLETERRDLMNPCSYTWKATEGVVPLKEKIVAWEPVVAKVTFLSLFRKLYQESNWS